MENESVDSMFYMYIHYRDFVSTNGTRILGYGGILQFQFACYIHHTG